MKRIRLGVLAGIAALSVAVRPAPAQNVLDQQQTSTDCIPGSPNSGYFEQLTEWSAQTFQTSAANVSGGGFYLTNPTDVPLPSTTVTIDLWSGNPSSGGILLAGASASASFGAQSSSWIDVYWTPVSVLPATTYWLGIVGGLGPAQGLVDHCAAGSFPYPNGAAYHNDGPDPTSPYQGISILDLTFRSYTNVVSVTPEPATLTLLSAGLTVLMGAGLRRRKRT